MAMRKRSNETSASGNTDAGDNTVIATSSSFEKLRSGFLRTKRESDSIRSKWEQKGEQAKTVFRCNGCMKKFKSLTGLKRHWSGKNNKCSKASGYEEVKDLEVSNDDRMQGSKEGSKIVEAQKAATEVAERMRKAAVKASTTNGGGITVKDLLISPNIESILRKAEVGTIKKFLQVRFSPGNASKKYLAEKELKRRGEL